jgi:hypothetical protein
MKRLIEAPKLDVNQVDSKNEEIMHRWNFRMADGGHDVPTDNLRMALQILREWDAPTVKGRPSLITAYPGFGKSTLLELYLWHKLRDRDPDTGRNTLRTDFGAIIVKPKRSEVKALVEALNKGEGTGGVHRKDRYAYGMYGFNPDADDGMTPDRTSYDRQKTEQANYNVLVMTAEKLKQLTLQGALDSYRSFINGDGERCDRSLLIIDEKPTAVEYHQVTQRDLNELIEWASMQRKTQYRDDLYGHVRALRDLLENPDVLDKTLTEPTRKGRRFLIDKRIAYQLGDANDYSRLSKLRAIEHLVRYGGMVTKYENNGRQVKHLSCAVKVHYDWTHLNASILDGTGHLALELALINEQLTHIRPNNPPRYDNLHYFVSKAHNLNKKSLGKKKEPVLAKMKEYCEQIQQRHPGVKFLVITYKKYEPELKSALEGNPHLITKHFDGGRATNDFIDCDGVIFLGNYFKTTDYYVRMASAINGFEIEYCQKVDRSGGKFTDENVEDFRLANQLEDFMQELSRTRPVQKDVEIPVYMFTKDEAFIRKLNEECPGAKFDEYEAPTKITGKESAKHRVARMILAMEEGEEVHKATWYKEQGISKKAFSDAMKTQNVQCAMDQNNVKAKGHKLIKGDDRR